MTDDVNLKWGTLNVDIMRFSSGSYRYWLRGYHIHFRASHGNPVGYGFTAEQAKNACWTAINNPRNFVYPGDYCRSECPKYDPGW